MRVLLAVDGSACSDMAVQTVMDRFRPGETQVKVLHAVEWMREMPLCFQYGSGPTAGHDVVESRNQSFERARELPADLIVIGSHGRRGLDRLFLGSVAESVARHAPCSVNIVRIPVAAAHPEALQSRDAAHR